VQFPKRFIALTIQRFGHYANELAFARAILLIRSARVIPSRADSEARVIRGTQKGVPKCPDKDSANRSSGRSPFLGIMQVNPGLNVITILPTCALFRLH
jgi:hypothetical protein